MTILKLTIFFAVVLIIVCAENEKGSELYKRFMNKKSATAAADEEKGEENYVYQSPNGMVRGPGGFGAFGYGGYEPWAYAHGYGHGYGNLGHIHPVPVTGVKALSVAYDPVSGVPYVCDPGKTTNGAKAATPAPPTGKRSDIKKDEVKVKIPDYPPCPDPKKSFPWSCLLGDKSAKREECARAKKAVDDAPKRFSGLRYTSPLRTVNPYASFGFSPFFYGYGGYPFVG